MSASKRADKKQEHFASMVRGMMETPAWRALTPSAQALYPWIRLEWHGARFNNNGKLRLSVRQAASKMGCGVNTAARAFQELQAKGFLVVTQGARLGLSGEAKSPSFELTELAVPHSEKNTGRRLYNDWQHGHDFPIAKAKANNPTGRREKQNPVTDMGHNVTILVTK